MRKRYREFWRGLGGVEKSFLVAALAYVVLRLTGLSETWQLIAAVATFILGFVSLVRFLRRAMRKAIWRLRNRLIVAYLFIAVVPIVLILSLAVLGYWVLVGQMAAYFVRTDLANREQSIQFQADGFAGYRYGGRGGRGFGPGRGFGGRGEPPPADARRAPAQAQGGRTPDQGRGGRRPGPFPFPTPATPQQLEEITRDNVIRYHERPGNADAEILITGPFEIRVPADSKLTQPPPAWGRTSGLVLKSDGDQQRLYLWGHSRAPGGEVREATILQPLSKDVLAGQLDSLGDVSIGSITVAYVREQPSRIPKRANVLDFWVRGYYPVQIYSWDNPQEQWGAMLLVDTRLSAVLAKIFEQKAGQRMALTDFVQVAFIIITGLFLLVELASLRAGIQLSRSITGSVHELYQATQHVKEGDFSYRIPVKGDDQLAELSSSFNTMTENLGQLIVVAKEKERLQSELEIAREVQNQLFPRDVPSIKTLELKGVCKPARVVSGDYYDFMSLPGAEAAFAIGDVAGKGISAALLMATIQSAMRTQLSATNGATPHHFSAAKLVGQLNKQLYANTTPEKYATFFFALYDETRHALAYTNAGHLPPVLVRRGSFIALNPTGTVVGAFPFAKYEERTVELEDGDILVAYTDGIVEPENPYGEMFGDNRLRELVLRYAYADSSEIIARTMEAVVQWTGSSELQDDMTMVVARRV